MRDAEHQENAPTGNFVSTVQSSGCIVIMDLSNHTAAQGYPAWSTASLRISGSAADRVTTRRTFDTSRAGQDHIIPVIDFAITFVHICTPALNILEIEFLFCGCR